MEILRFPQTHSVENILQSLNINVRAIEPDNKKLYEYENGVAYNVVKNGVNNYAVYINNRLSTTQKQKTLCHELGHIVLGHLVKGRYEATTEKQREIEAAEFASFIMPYIYTPVTVGASNG